MKKLQAKTKKKYKKYAKMGFLFGLHKKEICNYISLGISHNLL